MALKWLNSFLICQQWDREESSPLLQKPIRHQASLHNTVAAHQVSHELCACVEMEQEWQERAVWKVPIGLACGDLFVF